MTEGLSTPSFDGVPADRREPLVSVVVCAYTFDRLEVTRASVQSVLAQEQAHHEVLVVVDHNPELLARLADDFAGRAAVLASEGAPGLSGARNTGVAHAGGRIVAFLDDDAVAPSAWLSVLARPFEDRRVLGVGAHAEPAWALGRPQWFPDEFLWVVGCSYAGQRREGPVRNVLGCNMAFRKELFEAIGGFDGAVGRLGSRPLGAEETELCLRGRRWRPDGQIVMIEGAAVRHHVSADRHAFRYFVRRCFYEGVSKAVLVRLAPDGALESERAHLIHALPAAVVRELAAAARTRRAAPLLRAAAIVTGVVATGTGFLVGRLWARSAADALADRSAGSAVPSVDAVPSSTSRS